jgi:phosphate transport system substrate-binding protein
MRTLTVLVLVVLLSTAGPTPGVAKELEGTITLSGAWALYPMAVRWAEVFMQLHPGVRVDIGAGGAGKGMADALAGVVDLGMISRDIHEAEVERGAWWVSVTKDAVVPVISAGNPVAPALRDRGVMRDALVSLWIEGEQRTWGDLVGSNERAPVRTFTRSDACGAAQTWAQYLGGTQEDLRGVAVYGDPGLADAVRRDALALGYNNVNYVYDPTTKAPVAGLMILPLDLDGDGVLSADERFYDSRDSLAAAIARGAYPSPPARALHLASLGVPDRELVREFLRFILTEGQDYVEEAGYIRLPEAMLSTELAKLDAQR